MATQAPTSLTTHPFCLGRIQPSQTEVWFVLVTMNVLYILVAVLLFLSCKDPRVLWYPSIETTCWPRDIYLNTMSFIGDSSGHQGHVHGTSVTRNHSGGGQIRKTTEVNVPYDRD